MDKYAFPSEFICKIHLKNWLALLIKWRRQWQPTPVLLTGKSHGRRSLVGCSPWGCYGSDTTERLHFDFSLSCIGEGNGNPLQCSCLENPRDGGAWWAAIYGVTQSRTWLKQLSSSSLSNSPLFNKQVDRNIKWFSFRFLPWNCGSLLWWKDFRPEYLILVFVLMLRLFWDPGSVVELFWTLVSSSGIWRFWTRSTDFSQR